MKKWIKKASLVGFVIGTPIIGLSVGINTISQNVTQKTVEIPIPFNYTSRWWYGWSSEHFQENTLIYVMPRNFLSYKTLKINENLTLSKWGTSNCYTKDYSFNFQVSLLKDSKQTRESKITNNAGAASQGISHKTEMRYDRLTDKLIIDYTNIISSVFASTDVRGTFTAYTIALS